MHGGSGRQEFGDGITSAIDFDMAMERLPYPKGDLVKIGMTGKFLPFKYYGATGNALAYGLKEEGRVSERLVSCLLVAREVTPGKAARIGISVFEGLPQKG